MESWARWAKMWSDVATCECYYRLYSDTLPLFLGHQPVKERPAYEIYGQSQYQLATIELPSQASFLEILN